MGMAWMPLNPKPLSHIPTPTPHAGPGVGRGGQDEACLPASLGHQGPDRADGGGGGAPQGGEGSVWCGNGWGHSWMLPARPNPTRPELGGWVGHGTQSLPQSATDLLITVFRLGSSWSLWSLHCAVPLMATHSDPPPAKNKLTPAAAITCPASACPHLPPLPSTPFCPPPPPRGARSVCCTTTMCLQPTNVTRPPRTRPAAAATWCPLPRQGPAQIEVGVGGLARARPRCLRRLRSR